MDIRKYFSQASTSDLDLDETQPDTNLTTDETIATSCPPQAKKQKQSASEKRRQYVARLSYKREWEKKYPWVSCTDSNKGMFCTVCQKWGHPSAGSRGAWTTRGITDWKHATELLKSHAESNCHKDAAVTASMALQAERGKTVLELHCSAAAKELAMKKQQNREILMKLFRSVYFMIKNRIPHCSVYPHLIELQIANGDKLLEQHIKQSPANAQYTSKFSANMLLESLDTWLDKQLIHSLQSSPCFSIMADECQDISSHEELSICFRWIVNGHSEEHFLDILHIKATDASTITDTLLSFVSQKNLDITKLVGQGYDGAAVFSGHVNGVAKRMQVHSAHAVYIHCTCHRLQLASLQAADSVIAIKKLFGTMANLWKFFYYSSKKAEALKEVQSVLNMPELKVLKPSDTRWLSHERCLRAILKELPALITTLNQLYETSGDAEAYGLALVLSSFSGVASIVLLSKVLDLLAKLNCFMQRQATDFSRLPLMIDIIKKELEQLKEDGADWCSEVTDAVEKLEEEFGIVVRRDHRTRHGSETFTHQSVSQFQVSVAVPYIDKLLSNMDSRFSDGVVKLLVSSSVYNPASLPSEENLTEYGKEEIKALAQFYGSEAKISYEGQDYTSPPLLDKDNLIGEWQVFKRALKQETKLFMEKNKLTKMPTMSEVKVHMESTGAYTGIFPETFKLLNIILVLPVGTASVERSFSYMKLIKTRIRNSITDQNLGRLMRIAIEGPELSNVNFNEVLDIFKQTNRRILL